MSQTITADSLEEMRCLLKLGDKITCDLNYPRINRSEQSGCRLFDGGDRYVIIIFYFILYSCDCESDMLLQIGIHFVLTFLRQNHREITMSSVCHGNSFYVDSISL